MNQAGRDILIQAALEGHPQARGTYHARGNGILTMNGDCAIGVLHLSLHHQHRDEAIQCVGLHRFWGCIEDLAKRFGLSRDPVVCDLCPKETPELDLIPHLNDVHELDFLTIANKLPATDELRVS